jgi:hypothetical protein
MKMAAVNALNVHPSGFYSDNSIPNGPHVACQLGGAQNLISDNSMTYFGGNHELTANIETFNEMIGGAGYQYRGGSSGGAGFQYRGGSAQGLEDLVKEIGDQVGGGTAFNDASYSDAQLGGMEHAVVQMGGKVKKDQSISEAFFTLLKNRKYLAIQRKNELVKGFNTLLKTRKKLFKQRKEVLNKTFSGMRGRSPAERMIGRDMRQMGNSDRIALKFNIGKSMGRSIGKSIGQAGGRRRPKCSKSCRKKHRHHRHTLKGGAGYAIAGMNISPSDSALAPGLFARYNDCPVNGTYQHPV